MSVIAQANSQTGEAHIDRLQAEIKALSDVEQLLEEPRLSDVEQLLEEPVPPTQSQGAAPRRRRGEHVRDQDGKTTRGGTKAVSESG